jgi:hypothetical protein
MWLQSKEKLGQERLQADTANARRYSCSQLCVTYQLTHVCQSHVAIPNIRTVTLISSSVRSCTKLAVISNTEIRRKTRDGHNSEFINIHCRPLSFTFLLTVSKHKRPIPCEHPLKTGRCKLHVF